MILKLHRSGILAAGLALFSMFFGAGDLIWPLIIGGQLGDRISIGVWGFLISGVSLPLLGLFAMMVFEGDFFAFFRKAGAWPGAIMLFLVQMILGPFGSLPRLLTLAHATLLPYLPEAVNLLVFSLVASLLVFFLAILKNQIVDILGVFLSPIMLLTMGAILIIGFWSPPTQNVVELPAGETFLFGLNSGYNTLDLIASFIFAPLVFSYFKHDETTSDKELAKRHVYKKMSASCIIAGLLLGGMYLGLTFLASYYTPYLPVHRPEERLGLIALKLLGTSGAFISCIAIALSCLTTAIPITAVVADYIKKEFLPDKTPVLLPIGAILLVSTFLANIGFMGIAEMLTPILQILCPPLTVLSVLNILNKLYAIEVRKSLVYITIALSVAAYFYQAI
jgi:branched-chain amino acid:cation transporter, LIVCS family